MVIHLKDEHTDALVRELASLKGVGITTAIREAVEVALDEERSKASLWDKTRDLRDKFASYPRTGQVADKAFFDSLAEDD